ncbi:MAG: ABC transporter permease [Ruminococcus sp.]|nr:ABC transporter permease [Candidatus Apopatosoma intestinale]
MKRKMLAFFASFLNTTATFFRKKETKDVIWETIRTLAMLLFSLLCAVVVIALASRDDPGAVKVFLTAPFEDGYTVSRILTESIPLMFTGSAVCLMSRAGQFNMFVEGGFFVGAFVSAVLAPELCTGTSSFLVPVLCILAGTVAAAALGYIPAKLKSGLGIDEFVSSLMMNYIVLWVVLYLLNNVWGDPEVTNATKYLEDFAKLPFLSRDNELSSGFIMAVAVAVLCALFLFKTKWGYEIRLTGNNREFASYSGIRTDRVVVYSQLIGSGLAGFGGGVYLLGNYYRFTWKTLPNYGFDGFVIAIMARNSPILVPFASLFLAYLRVGAQQMSLYTNVQHEVIYIIQGIIIILFGAKFLMDMSVKKKRGKEMTV